VRFKGVRPVGVLSVAGELTLRRRYYWGRGVGGCYPSDAKAGIAASAVTAGARELCCVMGLSGDFRAAAANLRRVGGLAVCPERLRQVVEGEAAAVAAGRDAGVVPPAWSARADPLERGRLYVGADGLLVRAVTQAEKDKRRRAHAARRRQRGKAGTGNLKALPDPRPGADQAFKEVKFAVFYDQPKDRRHLLATAGDGGELGRLLRAHAGRVGIDHARQRVALTDGAPWVARQLRLNLPMLTAHVLDFYHLAEHVHAAANACLGEGTPAARGTGRTRGWARPSAAAPGRSSRRSTRWPGPCGGRRPSARPRGGSAATSPSGGTCWTTRGTAAAGGTSARARPKPAGRTWPRGSAGSG
jgi:hypothetical protein